jgi:hypothetical protein
LLLRTGAETCGLEIGDDAIGVGACRDEVGEGDEAGCWFVVDLWPIADVRLEAIVVESTEKARKALMMIV